MENIKENKMGTMPENRLLISMSLPIMISMLVQALYNIVDSIFVAKINQDALTAVSLAFPMQNLMIALGAGTGVGINALLSKSLGEKNFKQANKAASSGILLILVNFLIFVLIGLFFTDAFYRFQTADLKESAATINRIRSYGKDYLSIVCLLSIGSFSQMTMEKLLQSTGKTMYSMITQSLGAVVNIVFDPCLIFGLGFFPKMGVKGAAAATIIGQISAGLLALFFNKKFNTEIEINLIKFKPELKTVKKIYAVGLPAIIMQAIGSVMTFTMNKLLIAFSSTAVAVFGVYFKLQSFVFMPIFGLNNGLIPILAYNYGARKKKRILKTMRLAMVYSVSIMAIGLALMQLIPEQMLKLFDADNNMLKIGIPALRTISLCFVFAGVSIVIIGMLQALGHGIFSMIISIARQLGILIPAAYFLSKLGNVDYIWWSFPIAEIASVIMCTLFYLRVKKTSIDKLSEV